MLRDRIRAAFVVVLVAFVVVLRSGGPAVAQDAGNVWPRFRGPGASGIAAGAASPPLEFGAGKNQLWKTALPVGHGSPAIWGDRIFLTGADPANKKLETIAIDRATGGIVWRQAVSVEQFERVHVLGNAATATPAVDGERVYAYFGSYGLVAYDVDGQQVWELRLPVLQNNFGSGTSPVVAGDLVILNRQEPKDPFIIALDKKTGKQVWKQPYQVPPNLPTPYASYSTPLVVGQQVIIHGMNRLDAFDLATGERKWWIRINSSGTSSPIFDGGTIYVASWSPFGEADQLPDLPDFATLLKYDKNGNGTLSQDEIPPSLYVFSRPDTPDVPGATYSVKAAFARFDTNKDGELQKEEWEAGLKYIAQLHADHGLLAVRPGGNGDVTATNVIWTEKTSIPEVPTPIAYQNRIYMIRNGGVLTCVDAATGHVVYRGRVGASGPYFSSPVIAGGRLLVASGDGVVSVLGLGDDLQVLARNDLGETVMATPAVVGGVLYVRTASAILAFGGK
jgi:outer membrane protein assembly factor BamB